MSKTPRLEESNAKELLAREIEVLRELLPRHRPDGPHGNLGVMKFHDGERQTLALIVAASFTIYDDLRELIRESNISNAYLVNLADDGSLEHEDPYTKYVVQFGCVADLALEQDGSLAPPPTYIISPNFSPRNRRQHDSEYLLLEFAHDYIKRRKTPALSIQLLTELPPCPSCTKVIRDFLDTNDSAHITLYHLQAAKDDPATKVSRYELVHLG